MNLNSSVAIHQGLEQFRQLLFHLQMQCGSIHEIFRFFKEEESMKHFEALKALDPNLMSQLLAREYVLEARQTSNLNSARKHLETALHLDPVCPEACLELATICTSPEASMKWFQKCMDSTKLVLGEDQFNDLLEQFKQTPWQQVELFSYMKAKLSLAERLFRQGFYEVSIIHLNEMLDWNPTDDINIRHFLMIAFICDDRLKEALVLKRTYSNDLSAQWCYSKAFLQFKMEGDTRRSRRLLQRAFRRNLWAIVYALGLKEMPEKKHPKIHSCSIANCSISMIPLTAKTPVFKEGGQEEAVECVACIAPALLEDRTLSSWAWENLKEMHG